VADVSVQQDEYLKPEDVTVFRNKSNNLCVRIKDVGEWEKVVVKLAFPYSAPGHFIVLSCDEKEIGVIRDLDRVADDSRALLKEMLAKRYHIPQIKRIYSVEQVRNATRWSVETDKGRRSFEVRDSYNFRFIENSGSIVIIDVDANRFRISDLKALDEESRKLLDMYM